MRRMNSGTSSDRPSSRIEAKASLLEVNLHAHTAHMMLGINRILQRESHLDVIILCEDQIIRAHRLMLAAASGYFERVLDIVANASHQVPVILLPPSFEMFHVRKIIDFIYTGDVLIPEDKLQDFCDVVNFLEIRGIGGLMNSSTLIEGPEIVLESEDETVTEDLESSDELVQSPENRCSQKKRRVVQTSESEDTGNKMEVAEPERKVRKTAPSQTSTNRKEATPALHQDEGIEGDRSPVDSASQEEERPSPRMLPSCLRPDARTERVEGPIWAGSSSEGKRLYFCCQCSYVSTGKTNAVRHGRVHTGDKPYACSHCSQAFSRQDGLNTHVRRAHEPRQQM